MNDLLINSVTEILTTAIIDFEYSETEIINLSPEDIFENFGIEISNDELCFAKNNAIDNTCY